MKIELQTTATKLDCHFIGKVAYPDTEKFEIYKKIFRNAETESSLKELLKNDNINDSAISEFCQTLNKLGLIKENGELTSEPLIAEYGDYILTTIIQAKDEVPYQWLPLQLKRNLQEQDRSYEERPLDSKELESAIKQTEIFIPKNPIGRVFNIESPETKCSYNGDVPIRIEIDPDTNNWNLNIERNSFSIPEKCQISYQVFFQTNLSKTIPINFIFRLQKLKIIRIYSTISQLILKNNNTKFLGENLTSNIKMFLFYLSLKKYLGGTNLFSKIN